MLFIFEHINFFQWNVIMFMGTKGCSVVPQTWLFKRDSVVKCK